jgi:hypothetical protein
MCRTFRARQIPVLLANNKIICIYYSSSFFINCPWKLMAIINPMVMKHGLKMKRILLFLLFFFSLFSSPSPSLFTKYAPHMYVPKALFCCGMWDLLILLGANFGSPNFANSSEHLGIKRGMEFNRNFSPKLTPL